MGPRIADARTDLFDVSEIRSLASAGFYLAIRVGFAFPRLEHNELPSSWVREYTISGLVVHDPAIAWAYRNQGVVRMNRLASDDSQGVIELGKNHGLLFGAVASCTSDPAFSERSFGVFYRTEREYLSAELNRLHDLLVAAHGAATPPQNLTAAELEALGLVKNGVLMKEMAVVLGISESAIKQRLKSARQKLNAKTGSQAAAKAVMLGMI